MRGIKFFFEMMIGKQWRDVEVIRPLREKAMRTIPGREEVRKILSLVRLPALRSLPFDDLPLRVTLQWNGTFMSMKDPV